VLGGLVPVQLEVWYTVRGKADKFAGAHWVVGLKGTHPRGVSVVLSLAFRPASDRVQRALPMMSERRI
jgi:hypothetical protein